MRVLWWKRHANACCDMHCQNCPISRFFDEVTISISCYEEQWVWRQLLSHIEQWMATVSCIIDIVGCCPFVGVANPKDWNLYQNCSALPYGISKTHHIVTKIFRGNVPQDPLGRCTIYMEVHKIYFQQLIPNLEEPLEPSACSGKPIWTMQMHVAYHSSILDAFMIIIYLA